MGAGPRGPVLPCFPLTTLGFEPDPDRTFNRGYTTYSLHRRSALVELAGVRGAAEKKLPMPREPIAARREPATEPLRILGFGRQDGACHVVASEFREPQLLNQLAIVVQQHVVVVESLGLRTGDGLHPR